jgi:hypothetical protein
MVSVSAVGRRCRHGTDSLRCTSPFVESHERACGISVERQVVDGEKETTSPACSAFRKGAREQICAKAPTQGAHDLTVKAGDPMAPDAIEHGPFRTAQRPDWSSSALPRAESLHTPTADESTPTAVTRNLETMGIPEAPHATPVSVLSSERDNRTLNTLQSHAQLFDNCSVRRPRHQGLS